MNAWVLLLEKALKNELLKGQSLHCNGKHHIGNSPKSLPKPDCLNPPNGAATSVLLYVLTKQVPASSLLAINTMSYYNIMVIINFKFKILRHSQSHIKFE